MVDGDALGLRPHGGMGMAYLRFSLKNIFCTASGRAVISAYPGHFSSEYRFPATEQVSVRAL
jgi:hypothetical protein